MTEENVILQNIFDKDFGKRPYWGGKRAGGDWLGPPLILLDNWAH